MQVPAGPYSLTCSYCHWNSKEIGLEFEKPSGLPAQLAKQLKAAASEEKKPRFAELNTYEDHFAKLKTHYTSQGIGAAGTGGGGLGVGRGGTDDYGTSPGTLSRLMVLYTGGGHVGKRNISGLSARGVGGRDASGKKTELTEMEDVEVVKDEKEIIDRMIQVEFDESTWLP